MSGLAVHIPLKLDKNDLCTRVGLFASGPPRCGGRRMGRDLKKRGAVSYRVHRFDIHMEEDASKLEAFLNGLAGEVVAIIPNVKSTTLAQIYGATRKVDFLLVVERV